MTSGVRLSYMLVAGLLTASHCEGQPSQETPAFEVASVKLNAKCENGGLNRISPGRLDLPCMTLRALIRIAYGNAITGGAFNSRRMDVLGGPAWLDTDRYDIAAKAEGTEPPDQVFGVMLQALLEHRFQVAVHKETRETAVYALTVEKANPHLQPLKEGSCVPIDLNNLSRGAAASGGDTPKFCGGGGGRMGANGVMTVDWNGLTMAEFTGRALANVADRPVVDQTGLTGRFDIHLEFVRQRINVGGPTVQGDDPAAGTDPPGPSIFDALREQLGLKLSPAKSSVEVIVVDRAEKPSAN